MGLPVHLWSKKLLKRIGESYGGFIAVDESMRFMTGLSRARMLIKVDGRVLPNSIEVVEGTKVSTFNYGGRSHPILDC